MAKLFRQFRTGRGVFGAYGNRVRVIVAIPQCGIGQWEFEYVDEELARMACEQLRDLLATDHEIAVQLKGDYCLGNLAEYLTTFLPSNGLVSGYRNASLVFDGHLGLREEWVNGQLPVNVEDIAEEDHLNWRPTGQKNKSVTRLGKMQAEMLRISGRSQSRSSGYIRDPRSPYEWLSELVSCR